MWDLLEDLSKELADRLEHHGRWYNFRWYPNCVSSVEIIEEVMMYLDSDRKFKFTTRRYALGLCQKLVDISSLEMVSCGRPTDLNFEESTRQFWRLRKQTDRTCFQKYKIANAPFFAPMIDFPSEGSIRYGVVHTSTGLLCIYKDESAVEDVPMMGVCLTQFRVERQGLTITLAHPHSRLADITWTASTETHAYHWTQRLSTSGVKVGPPTANFIAGKFHVPGKKRVVVLGGGYCGVHVATELQDKFHVSLIDSKDYFENTPSVLKTLVEPEYQKYIHRDYRVCLPRCDIVTEKVWKVTPDRVLLEKRSISYDYLVIATGSSYKSDLIKTGLSILPSRNAAIRATHVQLEIANHVLVIGGGLVGVELAAEIIYKYPTKRITLVESGPRLLQRHSEAISKKAFDWLQKRGVDVLLSSRVVEAVPEHKKIVIVRDDVRTEIFNIDIDFICTGVVPNSDFLQQDETFKNCLQEDGHILVDQYLQVSHDGASNERQSPLIFAGGDIVATGETKLAQNARSHALCIAANIISHSSGKGLAHPYQKATSNTVIISLGPNDGILVPAIGSSWATVSGWVAACGKGYAEYEVMKRLTPSKLAD
eukprot:TRINITY_DN22814_c0_g1_i1.p1 TRINITY_DN22814_c0_g1~~TRINITY_DN22814_c0_g1_i1.p1  ORF type:complete len:595 (+),score=100.80 TRINITY_DN22814_c0_g1_i1:42-1826(+)